MVAVGVDIMDALEAYLEAYKDDKAFSGSEACSHSRLPKWRRSCSTSGGKGLIEESIPAVIWGIV